MSMNDITGDALRSKATTDAYRQNWTAIFRPFETQTEGTTAVQPSNQGLNDELQPSDPATDRPTDRP